jgi:hypothetical protein
MSKQHTPGPWTAKQQQPDSFGAPIFGQLYVCAGACVVAQHCRNEDDASLIAKAPELLEKLTWIRQFIHKAEDGPGVVIKDANGADIADWLDDVDEVIAKATGETA